MYASSIFILKPKPIKIKLIIRYLNFPFSAAFEKNTHAINNTRTNRLSIVLFLLAATNTGVIARHMAAIIPAA